MCVARASASTAGWAISLIVLLVLAALVSLSLFCYRLWLLVWRKRKRKRKEKEEEDTMVETCLIDARRYPYSTKDDDAETMSSDDGDDDEGALRTCVASLRSRVKRPIAKTTTPPNSTGNTPHAGVMSSPDGRRDSMARSPDSFPGQDGTGIGTDAGGLRGRIGSVWSGTAARRDGECHVADESGDVTGRQTQLENVDRAVSR